MANNQIASNLSKTIKLLDDMKGFLDKNRKLFDKLKLVDALHDEDPRFIGAILLDSFFYPLYKYMDISFCSNPKIDFINNPINYLANIGKKLELDKDLPKGISFPEEHKRYNTIGNPFKNKADCVKLIQIDADKYYKKDIAPEYVSTITADFNRGKGFPVLINDISSLLSVIAAHINGESEANIIRALFLLYILEQEMDILTIYHLGEMRDINNIFEELYDNRRSVRRKSDYYNAVLPTIILRKEVAKNILSQFLETQDSFSPVLSILDYMNSLSYIKKFIHNNDFFSAFKSFSDEFKEAKPLDHELKLLYYYYPSDNWGEILKDNKAYRSFLKNNLRHLSFYGIKHNDSELMINPFPLRDSHDTQNESVIECPFRIYTHASLKDVYNTIAEIEIDIAERNVEQARQRSAIFQYHEKPRKTNTTEFNNLIKKYIKFNYEYNLFIENVRYFIHPLSDFVDSSFLSVKLSEIVKELKLDDKDSVKKQQLFEQYFHNESFQNYKQIFNSMCSTIKSLNTKIRINECLEETDDNQIEIDFLNPFWIMYITNIIDDENKLVSYDDKSVLDKKKKIVQFLIKYKYDYLLNAINKKHFKDILDCRYRNSKEINGITIDIRKPMPYMLKLTIREWRQFFDGYCKMLRNINKEQKGDVNWEIHTFKCETITSTSCKECFFRNFHDVYMQDMYDYISDVEI